MDDFSSTYEKLIDMGFTSIAIDSAIEVGFYTFDDIFNALVDKEQSHLKLSTFNNIHQQSFACTNKKSDTNLGIVSDYDDNSPRQPLSEGDALLQHGGDNLPHIHPRGRSGEVFDEPKLDVMTNYPRMVPSSPGKASSLLPTRSSSSSAKPMAKIQIMDLLDPSYEPQTYTQPFIASMISVRDIICWFSQSRNNKVKDLIISHASFDSRVAISCDTDMHTLIGLFEDLKWHLVLPSGADSLRLYGRDYLDKYLDQLGLVPSAHLLAIVGCPAHIRGQISSQLSSSQSSSILSNNNATRSSSVDTDNTDHCYVHIRMINYRNNPLYLHGRSSFKDKYDLDHTTLQNVVSDFSDFCGQNLQSFVFLQMNPSKVLSYPDDYLRSLRDLSFVGTVTLYCHQRSSVNEGSHATISPYVNHIHTTFPAWDYNNSNDNHGHGPSIFPGPGEILYGSLGTHKTLREVWSDRKLECTPLVTKGIGAGTKGQESLFRMCLSVLYRSVKEHLHSVCRHLRRLPNSLQQILIRQLIEDKCLSSVSLSYFCTGKSGLVSLDLSYTAQATNEVLKCVSKCTNLQELILDNEDHVFTNDGVWYLRACVHLRRLSLNYCSRISDWGLQVLTELPRLSVLSIKQTGVTDAGLAHIFSRLTTEQPLASLDLSHLHLTSTAMLKPQSMPSTTPPPLTSIDLSGLTITDKGLHCLSIFSSLQLLNLASTAITDPCSLPYLPHLQHLDISHCLHLTWDKQTHIHSLNECFPVLSSIAVRDIANHNLVHLTKAIALCPNLRQIEGVFNHPQMTASLLATISYLPLDSIVLTNASHVNDLWLPVLARFSATLNHLVLSSCHNVLGHNDSLLNHLSRLSHLSWLDLTHLENVDSKQVIQLLLGPYFPRMQVVWFSLTEEEEFHFRSQLRDTKFKINITRSLQPHNLI